MQDEGTQAQTEEIPVPQTEELPVDISTDHTEAYLAQLQLQAPPSALYHFSRQFAGSACLALLLHIVVVVVQDFWGSVTSCDGVQLQATGSARTRTS